MTSVATPARLATAVDAPNKFDHDIWLTSGKLTFGTLDSALTNVDQRNEQLDQPI